jgi:hypothetical protein
MIQGRAQARRVTHGNLKPGPATTRSHQRHASLKLAGERFAQDGPRLAAAAASGTNVEISERRISPHLAIASRARAAPWYGACDWVHAARAIRQLVR